jgi:hypothetical protein
MFKFFAVYVIPFARRITRIPFSTSWRRIFSNLKVWEEILSLFERLHRDGRTGCDPNNDPVHCKHASHFIDAKRPQSNSEGLQDTQQLAYPVTAIGGERRASSATMHPSWRVM